MKLNAATDRPVKLSSYEKLRQGGKRGCNIASSPDRPGEQHAGARDTQGAAGGGRQREERTGSGNKRRGQDQRYTAQQREQPLKNNAQDMPNNGSLSINIKIHAHVLI